MSTLMGPFAPACIDPTDPLSHASNRPVFYSLATSSRTGRNSAGCQPKTQQGKPMAVTIDAEASETVCGGAGDEEVASIDEAFIGLGLCRCNGRDGRLVGRGGCPEGWRESAGPAPAPARVG